VKNTKSKIEVLAELESLRSEHWAYQMALAAFMADRTEKVGSFVQDNVKVSAFLIDPMRACGGIVAYRIVSPDRGEYSTQVSVFYVDSDFSERRRYAGSSPWCAKMAELSSKVYNQRNRILDAAA
jgi:hypothetical protein